MIDLVLYDNTIPGCAAAWAHYRQNGGGIQGGAATGEYHPVSDWTRCPVPLSAGAGRCVVVYGPWQHREARWIDELCEDSMGKCLLSTSARQPLMAWGDPRNRGEPPLLLDYAADAGETLPHSREIRAVLQAAVDGGPWCPQGTQDPPMQALDLIHIGLCALFDEPHAGPHDLVRIGEHLLRKQHEEDA